MQWFSPGRCNADQPQCVEVTYLPGGSVAVRDSKRPDLIEHVFTAGEWDAFIEDVKAGAFDRAHPRNIDAVTREERLAGW